MPPITRLPLCLSDIATMRVLWCRDVKALLKALKCSAMGHPWTTNSHGNSHKQTTLGRHASPLLPVALVSLHLLKKCWTIFERCSSSSYRELMQNIIRVVRASRMRLRRTAPHAHFALTSSATKPPLRNRHTKLRNPEQISTFTTGQGSSGVKPNVESENKLQH